MLRQFGKVEMTRQALGQVEIFQELSEMDLAKIARRCRATRYPRGKPVVPQNDMNRDLFFVLTGRVCARVYSVHGKQVIFQDLGPGMTFGELAAIDGEPRSTDVVTTEDSLIGSMSSETFRAVRYNYPVVADAVSNRLTHLVRFLCNRLFRTDVMPVPQRVRAELLWLTKGHVRDNGAANIEPKPRHAELASRVGTHREAVTRELNTLIRMGVVERHAERFVIPDVAALERLVEEAV